MKVSERMQRFTHIPESCTYEGSLKSLKATWTYFGRIIDDPRAEFLHELIEMTTNYNETINVIVKNSFSYITIYEKLLETYDYIFSMGLQKFKDK